MPPREARYRSMVDTLGGNRKVHGLEPSTEGRGELRLRVTLHARRGRYRPVAMGTAARQRQHGGSCRDLLIHEAGGFGGHGSTGSLACDPAPGTKRGPKPTLSLSVELRRPCNAPHGRVESTMTRSQLSVRVAAATSTSSTDAAAAAGATSSETADALAGARPSTSRASGGTRPASALQAPDESRRRAKPPPSPHPVFRPSVRPNPPRSRQRTAGVPSRPQSRRSQLPCHRTPTCAHRDDITITPYRSAPADVPMNLGRARAL